MAYTAIDNPELYFQTKLFTGNGSTQSLTFDGDEDMQPDLLWFKQRDGTGNHAVFDSVRGTTGSVYRRLITEGTDVEDTAANTLTAIGSDGFSVGSDGNINGDTETMVAWCWKESATAGFDILIFDGNETNRTIAHSLSAVPHFMILKSRGGTSAWAVNHQSIGTYGLHLNSTEVAGAETTWWQSTLPTSSVFSVGTSYTVNDSGESVVAYLWTEKQGFSKFGSYTGNGDDDGPFIYTGFKPAFVMIKQTDSTKDWRITDNKRPGYNLINKALYANGNWAEGTGNMLDHVSNGFKFRDDNVSDNASGGTYIYMAFAEAPFVNSNGVPCNAR